MLRLFAGIFTIFYTLIVFFIFLTIGVALVIFFWPPSLMVGFAVEGVSLMFVEGRRGSMTAYLVKINVDNQRTMT